MKDYDLIAKDLNNVFKQVDDVFKQMDQVFKQVDAQLKDPAVMAKINAEAKWEPYITWMPKKIGKRWYWHSPIYRKFQLGPSRWIYGTEFDVMRDSK